MFSAFSLSVILTFVRFGPADVPPILLAPFLNCTVGGPELASGAAPAAGAERGGGGAAAVPEPTTLLLVGGGLVGLALARRRRRT